MLNYLSRVSGACCGKASGSFERYRAMMEELKSFPVMVEIDASYIPSCTYAIAQEMGISCKECYEAFTIAEFYDCCSRYNPSIFTLVTSMFEREKECLDNVSEICEKFISVVTSNETFKRLLDKGRYITNGSSRVFVTPSDIQDSDATFNKRCLYDEAVLANSEFARVRWVLDMLICGEEHK